MFFHRKEDRFRFPYDPSVHVPVIRSSICTGEQTAGFKNTETGKFTEVCLIRNQSDLDDFMKEYSLREIKHEY